jgi:hypothetical protein
MAAVTHPAPMPFGVDSTAHAAPDVADQAQLAVVVTVTVRAPPSLVRETLAGETEYSHGAAACETVIVCPPTVADPVRP